MLCQVAAVRVLSVVDKQRSHRRREVQGAAGGHMGATRTSGWATGGAWSENASFLLPFSKKQISLGGSLVWECIVSIMFSIQTEVNLVCGGLGLGMHHFYYVLN